MSASNEQDRPFPIQGDGFVRGKGEVPATVIPWWLPEIAYEHYVKRWGNDQSLERLAERGGFGRTELVSLLRKE